MTVISQILTFLVADSSKHKWVYLYQFKFNLFPN